MQIMLFAIKLLFQQKKKLVAQFLIVKDHLDIKYMTSFIIDHFVLEH